MEILTLPRTAGRVQRSRLVVMPRAFNTYSIDNLVRWNSEFKENFSNEICKLKTFNYSTAGMQRNFEFKYENLQNFYLVEKVSWSYSWYLRKEQVLCYSSCTLVKFFIPQVFWTHLSLWHDENSMLLEQLMIIIQFENCMFL